MQARLLRPDNSVTSASPVRPESGRTIPSRIKAISPKTDFGGSLDMENDNVSPRKTLFSNRCPEVDLSPVFNGH